MLQKMIKVLVNSRDYLDYEFIDPDTNNLLVNEDYNFINPIENKLFTNDYLELQEKSINLHYSYIREEAKMAGVLLLEDNKTYGRTTNGKRLLYKCLPDDKRLPAFLVPYDIKNNFNKKHKNKYVVFEFDNWEFKHPQGKLILTIGDIDLLENFYEYQLYCKSLNISINEFNKTVRNVLKLKSNSEIEDIILKNENYNIIDRTREYIFSIDNENSYDFDDALSVTPLDDGTYKVSIYISNVYLWIDTLNLWKSFSKRVSTIYLPDYRRPMLPTLLSEQLCSLQEKKKRFALVTDFNVDNSGNIKLLGYYNSYIKVRKNYIYQDSNLLKLKEYNLLLSLASRNDNDVISSHDVVSYWMRKTNAYMALDLFKNKVGIFRSVKYNDKNEDNNRLDFNEDTLRVVNNWNNITGQYMLYEENGIMDHDIMQLKVYIHITSPIRRLVDMLNQMMLMKSFDLINNYSDDAKEFLDKWLLKMEYINNSVRSIRKIQTECNILCKCTNEPDILKNIHNGVIFDKIKKNDGTFNYMVYLQDIKMLCRYITPIEVKNYSKAKFMLFVFHNEDKFKKKIRIQLV
jgi:exoribonuclease R